MSPNFDYSKFLCLLPVRFVLVFNSAKSFCWRNEGESSLLSHQILACYFLERFDYVYQLPFALPSPLRFRFSPEKLPVQMAKI